MFTTTTPNVPVPLSRKNALIRLATLLTYGGLGLLPTLPAPAQPQAGRIDGIFPSAARHGETVTIQGVGFGAQNVQITIAGLRAPVVAANGNQATFRVPTNAAIGATLVSVANPGGQTGAIAFRVLEGVLLPGPPSVPAIAATTDKPPVGVDSSLIQNGVFLSRIGVTFAPGATVDQVNRALVQVQGGIVSMAPGLDFATVAIPPQPNAAAVEALAKTLRSAPGILWAFPGHASAANQLPVAASSFQDTHLLPTRFPAAWNTIDLARRNCATQPKLPVLVIDDFQAQSLLPPAYTGFDPQVPGFHLFPLNNVDGIGNHGYDVTTMLAARFDANTPTGANPVTECLDVTGVQIGGIPDSDQYLRIRQSLPAGRFIVNYSQGFLPECATGAQFTVIPPLERAQSTLEWIETTSDHWSNFLVAASAGNCADDKVAQIYPGYQDARYNSPINLATGSDPTFSFMVNSTLWNATDGVSPDLTASGSDQALFVLDYLNLLQPLLPETNVLITGSSRQGKTFDDLSASSFSASPIDVTAVGEGVVEFGGSVNGTSFSAPQVAGLASYLWLLSNDLRTTRAVTDTREAIFQNTRPTGAGPTLDAYATILSLDAPGPLTVAKAPIRMALLDVNNDQKFDENDITAFLGKFLDANGDPLEPTVRDYSRYDLNGDGFTGGSRPEQFDLDRAGSTQYGKTILSTSVTQQIEGKTISFDENKVTDMEVLCYYAYSPLYTGDVAQRAKMLAGCAGVTVTITPGGANLVPGGGQQFSVTVTGASDPRVTWSSTGGTITSTGFYTAGNTAGTFKVRATSVVDSTAFAEVPVTIGSKGAIVGTSHPTFIGVCAKAGVVVSTSFSNPDMTFRIQGDARLTDKTIIGSTLFTTWAAGTSAASDIVLTFISVVNPNVSTDVTLRVDPFVAAYGANGSDTAFVVRGADASLPDNEYRVAVHKPFEGYNATFTAQAGGGGLTGTAGGDSLSVIITPDTMTGTIQAADGTIYHLNLTHNCAQ